MASEAEVSDPTATDLTAQDPAEATDPTARQLSALFAAVLADEPPSRVTPESVLREVHGEKHIAVSRLAAWLASGPASLKWAGGLVAAAALIGAVVLIGPMLTRGGTATSAVMADAGGAAASSESSSPESAEAASGSSADSESAAAGSASAYDTGSDSAAGAASSADRAESQADQRAAGGAAAPEAPMMGPLSSSQEVPAEPSHSQKASSAGSAAPSSAGTATSEAAPMSSPAVYCPLSPLSEPEWSAAVADLPKDVKATRLPGALCAAGALRGNGIEFAAADGAPGGLLWIVVADDPPGRNGTASDSTVVSATNGDLTVRVMANPVGAAALTEEGLQDMAAAVAAAR